MSPLHVIQEDVRWRVEQITATQEHWPCRKGCDDCCRHLASVPLVTEEEWQLLTNALDSLPADIAQAARQRIRDSAGASRPVVCPLLNTASGTCLVYEARPVACRSYGFYVERESVLGCSRIEFMAGQARDVVWGNHAALEDRLRSLGPAAELYRWLASQDGHG